MVRTRQIARGAHELALRGAAPGDSVRDCADWLARPIAATGASPGELALVDADGIVRVVFLPPYDVPLLTARYLKTRVRR